MAGKLKRREGRPLASGANETQLRLFDRVYVVADINQRVFSWRMAQGLRSTEE